MSQPSIAIFINALEKGGAQRVAANLTDHLFEAGWKVTLVTQYKLDNEYVLLHEKEIPRVLSDITKQEESHVPGLYRPINFRRRWKKLHDIWAEIKPDVILSFLGKNNIMTLSTARDLGIPVAVAVRSDPAREYADPKLRKLALKLFPTAAGVILQTQDGVNFFPEDIRRRSVVLPNPLNPEFMTEPFEGERDHRIVVVGRIDKNKHQSLVVSAFEKIADEIPEDYILEFYGDGSERENLSAEVARGRLSSRIFFRGVVTDVPQRIRKAGLFILSSDKEGMPNALIEAMALGIPCISTDCPCGGPKVLMKTGATPSEGKAEPSSIDHGDNSSNDQGDNLPNGILVPVGDADAMAEAMKKVINDPALARRLGRNALRVRAVYSPEAAFAAWEKYLRSIALRRQGKI
ncbi:MAG: glycosyltransferase [Lachnospiraceae bacterium]|jgi:glycosyltransferase involved in cell wall biosynthesis|nr:glycosyltransferase [Lachnospiraceae bacterium]MDD4525957.1 glycosyltransferase [Lachnospiraceae bacterium]